eukprot:TRINITY_DN668_c0_g1_i6.p1 TRINITY_DN668_c0_g1~~TRINITY_DN668_c0_g1_i6.p1  ORF type:complete len:311 (+),score=49.91 TRINITY_DN668_c0_g1_i6:420-1352(+)
MLRSWQAQSTPIRLVMSVSFASEDLGTVMRPLLQSFGAGLTLYFQTDRLFQFEHYRHIVDRLCQETDESQRRSIWLGFVDDDDLLHPDWAKTYVQLIRNGPALPDLPFHGVCVPRLCRADATTPADEHVRTAADVDMEYDTGRLKTRLNRLGEYTTLAVRFEILLKFVDSPQRLTEIHPAAEMLTKFAALTISGAFSDANPAVHTAVSAIISGLGRTCIQLNYGLIDQRWYSEPHPLRNLCADRFFFVFATRFCIRYFDAEAPLPRWLYFHRQLHGWPTFDDKESDMREDVIPLAIREHQRMIDIVLLAI